MPICISEMCMYALCSLLMFSNDNGMAYTLVSGVYPYTILEMLCTDVKKMVIHDTQKEPEIKPQLP